MLHVHQLKIIQDDLKQTGIWLGTGSGKTLIALSLARGKTLVIAPKTQKEDQNWEREVKKNNLKVDLTVISKETFRRDHGKLPHYETVIVDEAHTCLGVTPNIRWRNKQPVPKTSQIFEALESFIGRTKPGRLYLCTATIMKSPMTVWGAAKLLGHSFNFYEFRDTFYFKLPMPGRDVYSVKQDEASKNKLANIVKKLGYIGRLQDFIDMPEQTYKTVYVGLSDKQKGRIKDMSMEYPDPLVRIGKVQQIENGCLSGDEFSPSEFFENEKTERILDLAVEFPRMIIFARYRAQIASLYLDLKKHGYKVITLTGDTKDRKAVIEEANTAPECILIAQSQLSAGWEVPEYPCMVFASSTYSFVDRVQGEGRISRINRPKKNLYVSIVVKNGVDEAVHKCIEGKKDFDAKLFLNI